MYCDITSTKSTVGVSATNNVAILYMVELTAVNRLVLPMAVVSRTQALCPSLTC